MKLLLDTQAILWFLLDDHRLSGRARENISGPDALIFVSPASLWEIAIKISLGKYALPAPFETFCVIRGHFPYFAKAGKG